MTTNKRREPEEIARELCTEVVGCNECCRDDAGQCDDRDRIAAAITADRAAHAPDTEGE